MFWGFWGGAKLSAQEAEPAVQILTDRVYLYSYFEVLFKTPFAATETVAIQPASQSGTDVLRTGKLKYSSYRAEGGTPQRAFILEFYARAPGLHQLPQLTFRSTANQVRWQSPVADFAAFRVDEGELALPVAVQRAPLPARVYLGQNILIYTWAERVQTIDQNFIRQNPEFPGFLVRENPWHLNVQSGAELPGQPHQPQVTKQTILGQKVYRVPLSSWLLNPVRSGVQAIPAIRASIMGLERETLAHQLEVLPLPANPLAPQTKTPQTGALSQTKAPRQTEQELPAKAGGEQIAAIGRFTTSLQLLGDKQAVASIAKDEEIRVVYRIAGSGNMQLLRFPAIRVAPGLSLLQSRQRESLQLRSPAHSAELSGWREQEYTYTAEQSGKYEIAADHWFYFEPRSGSWMKSPAHNLSFEVTNQTLQPYYANLAELWFSPAAVFFLRVCFWLQQYAFYAGLLILLLAALVAAPALASSLSKAPRNRSGPPLGRNRQTAAALAVFGTLALLAVFLLLAASSRTENAQLEHRYQSLLNTMRQNPNAIQSTAQHPIARVSPSDPAASDPAASDPAASDPAASDPAASDPAASDSAASDSAASESAPSASAPSAFSPSAFSPSESAPSAFSPSEFGLGDLDQRPHSVGDLPNIALLLYRRGLLAQALEMAYLAYFYQPLQPYTQKLLAALRKKNGLLQQPPPFLVWRLQLYQGWRYLCLVGLLALSAYFVYKSKKLRGAAKQQDTAQMYELLYEPAHRKKIRQLCRNSLVLAVLLLASLALPGRVSLAINTAAALQLHAVPHSLQHKAGAIENADTAEARLEFGELVQIRGRAPGALCLVVSERQDQGWVRQEQLLVFP